MLIGPQNFPSQPPEPCDYRKLRAYEVCTRSTKAITFSILAKLLRKHKIDSWNKQHKFLTVMCGKISRMLHSTQSQTTNRILHTHICLERENLNFALSLFITHRLTDVGFWVKFSSLWFMQAWWNNLSVSITHSQIQMLNFSLLLQGADPAMASILDKRQQAVLGGTQIQI